MEDNRFTAVDSRNSYVILSLCILVVVDSLLPARAAGSGKSVLWYADPHMFPFRQTDVAVKLDNHSRYQAHWRAGSIFLFRFQRSRKASRSRPSILHPCPTLQQVQRLLGPPFSTICRA